jgi:6-phosphogluconolactonase (cycloisomerase 2 family)
VSSRLVNDGIAAFSLDKEGIPQKSGYQTVRAHPRHFAVSSDGKELVCAARDGHILEFFSIDPSSGALEKYKEQEITQPVFVIIK